MHVILRSRTSRGINIASTRYVTVANNHPVTYTRLQAPAARLQVSPY